IIYPNPHLMQLIPDDGFSVCSFHGGAAPCDYKKVNAQEPSGQLDSIALRAKSQAASENMISSALM
ncbi:MAG: hypothetical protein JRM72_09190, partial [Nitrososphaerota archaeon]|nr:hypothetical protein [Nitrososphaerota archaeon]